MLSQEVRAYLTEWRKNEDKYYGASLGDAQTYMLAIRLARAITDTLTPITELLPLVEQFKRSSSEDVAPIADALETPQVMMLDYQLALGAAFYLRAQEIQDTLALAEAQQRLAEARAQGQTWVTIYSREQKRYGKRLAQRLELRTTDGLGLQASGELDIEKGLVYSVESLMIDLHSGKRRQDLAAPEPRAEFGAYEEMMQAFEALLQKYS
jgi:hypothetical protein